MRLLSPARSSSRRFIESRRGDVVATAVAVKALLALTEEHSLKTYTDLGRMYANWVRGKQGEPADGGAWV